MCEKCKKDETVECAGPDDEEDREDEETYDDDDDDDEVLQCSGGAC